MFDSVGRVTGIQREPPADEGCSPHRLTPVRESAAVTQFSPLDKVAAAGDRARWAVRLKRSYDEGRRTAVGAPTFELSCDGSKSLPSYFGVPPDDGDMPDEGILPDGEDMPDCEEPIFLWDILLCVLLMPLCIGDLLDIASLDMLPDMSLPDMVEPLASGVEDMPPEVVPVPGCIDWAMSAAGLNATIAATAIFNMGNPLSNVVTLTVEERIAFL